MKAAQLFEFNIYIDILESFLWPKEYVDEKNKVFIRYFIILALFLISNFGYFSKQPFPKK